jgi:hypothetical protein
MSTPAEAPRSALALLTAFLERLGVGKTLAALIAAAFVAGGGTAATLTSWRDVPQKVARLEAMRSRDSAAIAVAHALAVDVDSLKRQVSTNTGELREVRRLVIAQLCMSIEVDRRGDPKRCLIPPAGSGGATAGEAAGDVRLYRHPPALVEASR